jgi:hypothetical protein
VIAAAGNDLAALDAKLDELALVGAAEFFKRLVGAAPGAPFELAGELARGDVRAALRGIEALFQGGFEGKDGKRELKPDALREILFGALRRELRRGDAGAQALAGARASTRPRRRPACRRTRGPRSKRRCARARRASGAR